MKKIKIAQIGIGHDHAADVFSTLKYLSDEFDLLGYAEVPEDDIPYEWTKKNYQAKEEVYKGSKKYTLEEILSMPELDAVTIETFDESLVKYAQMAADRGLHIHMDKASGLDAEAFEKLLSTVKKKNLAFSIGYMYRFNPSVREAVARIKKGEIGKIHSIDAEMSCYYGADKRAWLDALPCGMMQYLGCHLVDLAVRLQGVPEKIVAFNTSNGYENVFAQDFAFAVFQYPDGVSTVKSNMLDCGGFLRRHLIINGEKGSLVLSPFEKAEGKTENCLVGMSSKLTAYSLKEAWGEGIEKASGVFDRYFAMLSAFAAMVRGERDLEVDLQTEARVARCLIAACGRNCDFKGEIKL